MSERIPPFHPWSLRQLLNRVAHEWDTRGEIFGLAGRRFFKSDPDLDLSLQVGEHRIATPVGPAAGPHSQLAQNIVLGWLAGARFFELKTVQVLDELELSRPCIDMENVGYNVEWSQELTLEQSLVEYVKAWMMLEILRRWEPLKDVLGSTGDHVFEVSAGYDLKGIQSPQVSRFLEGLRNAGPIIETLRQDIPAPFKDLVDDFPTCIVSGATISTFHGCPPSEIQGIVKHLMTAHGLDVTVKLNPTLLGLETVQEILHDRLGHDEVTLVPNAFTEDQSFEQALAMINSLQAFGQDNDRQFGIKLTNTLVVDNTRGILDDERMYLSGAPLHVLAITLLEKLTEALPGQLQLTGNEGAIAVAFSAGINKDNVAATTALGLVPVTICSDLLRPGGYGRMAQGLRKLQKALKENGCQNLVQWQKQAQDAATAAGHRDAIQAYATLLADYDGYDAYTRLSTDRPLRKTDAVLGAFDCTSCGNCVTVCPNNAFFQVPSPEGRQQRIQFMVLGELCNECGNCTTFCPEDGSPHLAKPRLYTSETALNENQGQGYLVQMVENQVQVLPPVGSRPKAGTIAEQVAKLLEPETGLPSGAENLPKRT